MKIYRLMKVDKDGLPIVGDRFGQLGVRPKDPLKPNKRYDVTATTPTDAVLPGEGGMSVNADPTELQSNEKELVVWEIDDSDLGPELRLQPAGAPHFHVEPASASTLAHFQDGLAATRPNWKRVQ